MRVALLLPDGVGVRNFLLGSFIGSLAEQAEVEVLHGIPESLLPEYAPDAAPRLRWHALRPFRERALTFTLRHALGYAQMYWANTHAMRNNLRKPVRGSWRTRAAHRVARGVGRSFASPMRMRALDRVHLSVAQALPDVADYRALLERVRPTVLFCSHQRPPTVLPVVLAARAIGIPTATFIYSWDNLASKGRIAAPFEHYLVWSDHMRDELLRYYPDVSESCVHVVGSPQFDAYANPALLWGRDEFCARIGADPGRPIICYSGGDAGTCPEDPAHLAILAAAARDGAVRGAPQVLVRPSPVDDGRRFDAVRREFPELLWAPPEWVRAAESDWSRVFPRRADVPMLANITWHAAANVNVASTMTLDFALRDRPVVNIAFDASARPPFGRPLWDVYYQYEHYRPVVELGAARFARSARDLVDHLNVYLADPALDRDARARLVALQLGVKPGGSAHRITEALHRIASGG